MINKYLNAGGFALVLVCFLLPFVSIKCNNQKLADFKGYEVAFGKKDFMKDTKNSLGSMFGDLDKKKTESTEGNDEAGSIETPENTENVTEGSSPSPESAQVAPKTEEKKDDGKDLKPSYTMILLLAIAVIALVTSLLSKGNYSRLGLTFSLICLALLIITVFMLQGATKGEGGGEAMGIVIKIGYEIGFWVMLVILFGLIAANVFEMIKKKPLEVQAATMGDTSA